MRQNNELRNYTARRGSSHIADERNIFRQAFFAIAAGKECLVLRINADSYFLIMPFFRLMIFFFLSLKSRWASDSRFSAWRMNFSWLPI